MNVSRRLRRTWYYLRSFTRRDWTLDDYPISVRRQEMEPGEDAPTPTATLPAYVAMVDGLFVAGGGDTPEAARANLAENFAEYRESCDTPQRPGTQARVTFASTVRLEAHGTLRNEFIERVLKMDPGFVFVSDESSLRDFPDGVDEYNRRIMLIYGVDVDQLENCELATIFDAITKKTTAVQ